MRGRSAGRHAWEREGWPSAARGGRLGGEERNETLNGQVCICIYGALYRAELGLSGLGCLTEADIFQIDVYVNRGINRGGHVKVERLC